MKLFKKCCDSCLCAPGFGVDQVDFTFQGQSFSQSFPAGAPGPTQCERSVTNCFTDASWELYHDETVVGVWVARPLIELGAANCSCPGTYVRRTIQIDDRVIRRFKMWRKRRISATAFIEDCGTSQLRFVVQARVQYLWVWNSTVKTRNRYTIATRSCPANTIVTNPTVELGNDTGHPPPFPPFDFDYPATLGCAAETWEPEDTCQADDLQIVSITGRNNSCFDESRNFNLGVDTECSDCRTILQPNADRTTASIASVTYVSECFPCSSIPSSVELAIPGESSDISFSIYGSAFALGLCTWLTSFPASPVITIPRLLTLSVS